MDKNINNIINLFIKIVGVFLFFSISHAAFASVQINEIAWMGTQESSNDEWIELYNNSSNGVNIDGWSLIAKDGQPSIELSGYMAANEYFLLERTDDTSVSGVTADQIYAGSLGNAGEYLELFDDNGNQIDFLDNTDGWSGGDNVTKETMQLTSSGWVTATGTPRAKNPQSGSDPVDTVENNKETESSVKTSSSSAASKDYCDPKHKTMSIEATSTGSFIAGNSIDFEAIIHACDRRYRFGKYYWNFGDGTTISEKGNMSEVSHAYSFAGTYTVVLDYYDSEFSQKPDISTVLTVSVSDIGLSVKGIEQEGSTLFVSMFNNSNTLVDIGKWYLFLSGREIQIPDRTMIAPNVTMRFAINDVEGVVKDVTLKDSQKREVSVYPQKQKSTYTAVQNTISSNSKNTNNTISSNTVHGDDASSEEVVLLSGNTLNAKSTEGKDSVLLWLIPLLIGVCAVAIWGLYSVQNKKEDNKEKDGADATENNKNNKKDFIDDIEIIELD